MAGTAELTPRRMVRDDWPWIRSWFEDPVLDRELGPLDEEWLEHVLADMDGVQLVVLEGSEPVALIGCVWDPDRVEHGIADIAVDPAKRGVGLGRAAVDAVLAWPGHPGSARWLAFVDPENSEAFQFFTALGWTHTGRDDLMERFVLEPRASTCGLIRPRPSTRRPDRILLRAAG